MLSLTVDKTSHNLALICKKWYEYAVSQELENDAYNIVEDEDLNDILARHKEWNEKYKYNHYNILPYLYGSPKMQKDPPKLRFIAGISSDKPSSSGHSNDDPEIIHRRPPHTACSSTTAASTALSKQLQTIMDILQKKDQDCFNKRGYRRCWFVRTMDEVFMEIKHNKDTLKAKTPRTYDFSTMYTCLQQNRIIKNIKLAAEEAFKYVHEKISNDARRSISLESLWEIEKLMDHVEFVVKNTYIPMHK